MNGAIAQSKLAETIQQEFSDDGVMVKNARFNEASQKLELDADYENLD